MKKQAIKQAFRVEKEREGAEKKVREIQ